MAENTAYNTIDFIRFQCAEPDIGGMRYAEMIKKEIEGDYNLNKLDRLFKEYRRCIAKINFAKASFAEYLKSCYAEDFNRIPKDLAKEHMSITMLFQKHVQRYEALADRVIENLEVKRINL